MYLYRQSTDIYIQPCRGGCTLMSDSPHASSIIRVHLNRAFFVPHNPRLLLRTKDETESTDEKEIVRCVDSYQLHLSVLQLTRRISRIALDISSSDVVCLWIYHTQKSTKCEIAVSPVKYSWSELSLCDSPRKYDQHIFQLSQQAFLSILQQLIHAFSTVHIILHDYVIHFQSTSLDAEADIQLIQSTRCSEGEALLGEYSIRMLLDVCELASLSPSAFLTARVAYGGPRMPLRFVIRLRYKSHMAITCAQTISPLRFK
jgi:hypothetical protein